MSSLIAANTLLAITTLTGSAVSSFVPQSYSRNNDKIFSIPLEYREAELLEYLKDTGVIFLRRQAAYHRKDEEEVDMDYHGSVALHFVQIFRCRNWFSAISSRATLQCLRCQRHKHMVKHCRGPQGCTTLSERHNQNDCTSRLQPRCANCGSAHPPYYDKCLKK